ncbi:collagen alpha-3(VI) chain, partial [Elysia marginata]
MEKIVTFVIFLAAASLLPTLDARFARRQTEECPDPCQDMPMEISFIVDSSRSIWIYNFTEALWFVQDFVDKFHIGQNQVRVSMVTYGERVYSEYAFGFDAHLDKLELDKAIDNITHMNGETTETGQAIDWFLDHHYPQARDNVRHVLIVLTDGNSQQPRLTKAAARRAFDKGLEVFAIGVGTQIDPQELHNIASDGSRILSSAAKNIIITSFNPSPPRCPIRRINKNDPLWAACKFDPVDLVLVIDSSVSIEESNFTLGLRFIRDFLEPFEINPHSIRVAAVMFGDRVYTEDVIKFDMYNNKKDVQDAILALPWKKGTRTETGM